MQSYFEKVHKIRKVDYKCITEIYHILTFHKHIVSHVYTPHNVIHH